MHNGSAAHRTEVLAIRDATIVPWGSAQRALVNVDLTLAPGTLALVLAGPASPGWLLADACCGLAETRAGSVRFLGEDWAEISASRACGLRGRIGRVFEGENWLNYASVGDNIMMRDMHHTARPEDEIRAEAERVARDFGLPGLPTSRPHDMMKQDLQRAACARAFVGSPELILLEHPIQEMQVGLMGALMNCVKRARDRGAAALWITSAERIWRDEAIRADVRARLIGSQYVRTEH